MGISIAEGPISRQIKGDRGSMLPACCRASYERAFCLYLAWLPDAWRENVKSEVVVSNGAGADEAEERARGRVGTTVDNKWKLDSLLGVGGMAAVYAGTHRNGTRAAIKILNPEIALSTNAKTRFLREGYVANKIGHPRVVLVLDDDEAPDGTAYLVMELLDGETLQSTIAEGKPLPIGDVLRIAHDVLEVLEVAHAKDIVHRDLKPGNLLRTRPDGVVKLLDFGVAKVRESTAFGIPNVTTLSAMGTPGFMPPEQARGRWDNVDGRADIWALGATMFALLTCKYVHDEETPNEQLLAAMTKPARSLREIAPDVPERACAIVDRALAFDREERYRDAAAMKAAILGAMTELGLPLPAPTSTPPSSPTNPSGAIKIAQGTPNTDEREVIAAAATVIAPTTDGGAVSDVDVESAARPSSKPPPTNRRSLVWLTVAGALLVGVIAFASFGSGPSSTARDDHASPIATPALSPPMTASGASPTASASSNGGEPDPAAASSTSPPASSAPVARLAPAASVRPEQPAPKRPAASALPSAVAPAPSASVDIFGRRH